MEGSHMADLEQASAEQLEKRRYTRTPSPHTATLEIRSGWRRQSVPIRIQDASPTGLSIELPKSQGISLKEPVEIQWLVPPSLHKEAPAKPSRLRGTVVRSTTAANGASTYGIRLDGLIGEQIRAAQARENRIKTFLLVGLIAVIIALLKSRNVVSFWYQPELQIYSLAAAAFVLSRAALLWFYKEPEDVGYTTAISVVIAVKNEEACIERTVQHCFAARYPQDLLEVMVIDDGSTDKTWNVLEQLQTQFPNLKTYRFEQNKGKRHAMALGASKAKGNIVVFMDSDSLAEPEAFYRIVQPFADKRVGAVAGHTLVIVEEDNPISKMEAVRYFVSQRVMKAAESLFGVVSCCPGPLSAYRRDAIMPILPEWLNQTFLGTAATFGDDRSLTNFVLRGFRVVYHAGARCATYVPRDWHVYFRQQLRWKKSWFRETTIAVRFMFKKHPAAVLAYYASVVVTLVSPLIGFRALVYLPMTGGGISYVPYLLGLMLVYTLFGLIYYYFTQEKHWYYGLLFAFLYVFALSFQNYYALATVRRNHWGTR
jgi:hyaluronan synthase